jgi:hypothetical protein
MANGLIVYGAGERSYRGAERVAGPQKLREEKRKRKKNREIVQSVRKPGEHLAAMPIEISTGMACFPPAPFEPGHHMTEYLAHDSLSRV